MRVHGLDQTIEDWQKRCDNCDFVLPDEYDEFFRTLAGRARDALSPYGEQQWQFTLPINKAALARREWLTKALKIVKPPAHKAGIDFAPLFWLERYIHGDKSWELDQVEAVCDSLRRVRFDILGDDGKYRYIPVLEPPDRTAHHGLTVNQRMQLAVTEDAKRQEWTARRWSQFLSCGDGTVKGTATWKIIMGLRERAKREREASAE